LLDVLAYAYRALLTVGKELRHLGFP